MPAPKHHAANDNCKINFGVEVGESDTLSERTNKPIAKHTTNPLTLRFHPGNLFGFVGCIMTFTLNRPCAVGTVTGSEFAVVLISWFELISGAGICPTYFEWGRHIPSFLQPQSLLTSAAKKV
jgi:hypothetical protein